MKKNISINLFGTLYAIDEDAYELLDRYLESMKRYFSTKEGGDEIADDIEHRVAELLWEKKNKGSDVVDIKTVREIIETIGNASEISGGESEDAGSEHFETVSPYEKTTGSTKGENYNNVSRRLFRSAEDRKLGGVCAGLSSYFNCGDGTVWRIVLVALELLALLGLGSFFSGLCWNVCLWLPLIYLILWVIIPVANNAEDKLRMKGEKVTPENINKVIINESSTNDKASNNGGCLKAILIFLIIIVCFPFICFLLALLMGLSFMSSLIPQLAQLPGIMTTTFRNVKINDMVIDSMYDNVEVDSVGNVIINSHIVPPDSVDYYINNYDILANGNTGSDFENSLLLIVCGVIFLIITVYGLIRLVKTNKKKLNGWFVFFLIMMWLTSLVGAVYGIGRSFAGNLNKLSKSVVTSVLNNKCSSHVTTHEAVFATNENDYLKNINFYIIDNNCTEDRCTDNRHGTLGESMFYLDACNYNGLLYTAEHMEKVEPGIYRLKVSVRSDGDGAYVFLRRNSTIRDHYGIDDSLLVVQKMLAYGAEGGTLWEWASGTMSGDSANIMDSISVAERKKITSANDGNGNGWSNVIIDNVEIKEGEDKIYYGFTSNPQYTGVKPTCTWASATDFVLYKKNSAGRWEKYEGSEVTGHSKVKTNIPANKKMRKAKKNSTNRSASK